MTIKFYKHVMKLMLLASIVILSGCATIISSSKYPISINSDPSNAKITVRDVDGFVVYSANTPAYCTLKAGAGFFRKASYTVTFEKEGYDSKVVPILFDLDGWYFGNIIIGGLVGMLIIDPATGAMWRLSTDYINETLWKSSPSNTSMRPSLQVYDYNNIPEDWKANLVQINIKK